HGRERMGLLALGSTLAALAIGVGVTWPPAASLAPSASPAGADEGESRRPWHLAPVFVLLFFLYVGSENAVVGWSATHARRLGASAWMTMPALFWGGLLVGRGVAPALLEGIEETTLALAGLALAGLGTGALLATASLILAGAG